MRIACITFALIVLSTMVCWSHGPSGHKKKIIPVKIEPYLSSGKLPGITWVDDIHPIFVRNDCGSCHTRGHEAIVENLDEFALGIIDQANPDNPYYSYYELVYVEGNPRIRPGESLRDGQCCWPLDFPENQQRRIWLDRPERSVLLRKLDQDYIDWNTPIKTMRQGLKLLWGLPMPLSHQDEEGEKDGNSSLFKRSLSRLLNRDEVVPPLPERIPARDRDMIRYWIANTTQMQNDNTILAISLKDPSGKPLKQAPIKLFGNLTSNNREEVVDEILLTTDESGKTELRLSPGSVASTFWYFDSARLADSKQNWVKIVDGKKTDVDLVSSRY